MARGRMVSKSLGSSRKYAALLTEAGKLGEFAQVLYPLLVVNADDFGRQSGDAFTVKHAVFPTSPRRESDFEIALRAMVAVGLIHWYLSNGEQVVSIVEFDRHQQNLSKRTKSRFPEFQGTSVNFPEIPSQLNGTELNRTELN
jgi:hypothetical protein